MTYINDHFYDPVRGEHRDVAFGFFSYSLPVDPASSRAWRFVWDPIFFEFCQAARGSLVFDLKPTVSLDVASRRLFLLLKKIFWRNTHLPGVRPDAPRGQRSRVSPEHRSVEYESQGRPLRRSARPGGDCRSPGRSRREGGPLREERCRLRTP